MILVCIPVTANALNFEIFVEDFNANYQQSASTKSAENYFLSLLSNPYTEKFETQTPGTTNFLSSLGTIDAHFTVENIGAAAGIGANNFAGGTNGLHVYTNLAIEYSSPVNALGFYGQDWGDVGGQLNMTLSYLNGSHRDILIPSSVNAPSGSVLYFGLIDTLNSITRAEFNKIGYTGDLMGFDNFTVAKNPVAVPEPSTLLLLGSGLIGLVAWGRKRTA